MPTIPPKRVRFKNVLYVLDEDRNYRDQAKPDKTDEESFNYFDTWKPLTGPMTAPLDDKGFQTFEVPETKKEKKEREKKEKEQAEEAFWMTQPHHGTRGAGLLILEQKTNRVLLLLRAWGVSDPDVWGIPGGRVDEGKSTYKAAIRETREECGIIKNLEMSKLPPYIWKHPDGTFKFYTYLATVPRPFRPSLNWENTTFIWAHLLKARLGSIGTHEVHPGVRRAAAHFYKLLKKINQVEVDMGARKAAVEHYMNPSYQPDPASHDKA